MPNSKSPGHDGLNKKFYEHFWDDLKFYFIDFFKQCKIDGWLPISQRQAIIKIMAKKNRGKRFVKNWRPFSSNQTAYVKNQCISESCRWISDVTKMCDILGIPSYLVTTDIEKAFDSLDHDFLLIVLKKIGFGENFIYWIKLLLMINNHAL